ncbi:SH3 domain-containing protein [uncultured Parasphingorhabdus sp.]|uniref:SH3 domain-containing protein n=1 Tax=uncultured Parasphingorhabdus sp. TaxID=2709694 RepID=UPI002AA77DDC|nr:SH3 domain-containing protein [uncultured Parasphingorhabdus sp.]
MLRALRLVTALAVTVAAPAWAGSKHRAIELVQCDTPLGTVAVIEGDARSWVDKKLGSPKQVVKALVNQSRCFTSYQPSSGEASQFVLTIVAGDKVEVATATNLNSASVANAAAMAQNSGYRSGMGTAGDIAGMIPLAGAVVNGLAGAVGIGKENTVITGLTLIDTDEGAAVASGTGLVQKTKLKFHDDDDDAMSRTPEGFWMQAVEEASSDLRFTRKEDGREMIQGFVIAYNNMVTQAQAMGVGKRSDKSDLADAGAIADPAAIEPVEPTGPPPVIVAVQSNLYIEPSRQAETVRTIRPGQQLIPIGGLEGIFLPVSDVYGVLGWVSVEDLQ